MTEPLAIARSPGHDGKAGVTDRLLTAGEVAELLSVRETWVRDHTRNGHLPAVQLGRYWRYRREKVLAYIEEQERGGAGWRKHRPKVSAG